MRRMVREHTVVKGKTYEYSEKMRQVLAFIEPYVTAENGLTLSMTMLALQDGRQDQFFRREKLMSGFYDDPGLGVEGAEN